MKIVIQGEIFDIDKSKLIKEFTGYEETRYFGSWVDLPFDKQLYQRENKTYFIVCKKFGAKNITQEEANKIINTKQ